MQTTSVKTERQAVPVSHRWTREQYDQMIEAGILTENDRVELINGEIVAMSPQKSNHATSVRLLHHALQQVYGDGFLVSVQLPLALDPAGEPEPDISIVRGKPRDFVEEHPKEAVLVVEVSDATLVFDRTRKASLYTRHGIPDYWILNVVDECLEVYRDPAEDTYQTKQTLHRGDTIAPPQGTAAIAVTDVLP